MNDNEEKKLTMSDENGETADFYVLEETRLGGVDYLLVTDSESDDGECYILKDLSLPEDEEAIYEFVEDDHEIDYLYKIFSELLEDADVEIEK